MLKNFFKTAGRNILKYKAYSLINFLGLTTGLALALLILAYVRSEVSYDKFHEKADRLYRIKYVAPNGLALASTPPPIAPLMKEFFPGVEEAARMYGRNVSVTRPDAAEAFEETNVFFADSAIMKLLTFDFVSGNPDRALVDKFTVLITEEMARKYFGDKDPLGEVLLFSGKHSFKVIGVVKNFPENSHIRFNMLVPYENMFDLESDQAAQALRNNLAINFVISHSYTYVLLKPGADPTEVDRNMDAFLKKYAQPNLLVGQVFTLMPLTDIHLKSTLLVEPTPTNSMTNLFIFVGVGILTLVIASINYINLSTAQSFTRIKEIGIRKILGSMKYQLIFQFIAESFLFCLIALLLSFAVFYAALPLLNDLTNKTLVFTDVVDNSMLMASVILVTGITLLAGGYPAYFVTRFNSINALKGEASRTGSQLLRRALVVFQLAIACMLLSGSLLIVKQLNFLSSRPLGFQKEQTINIPLFSQNLNGIFRQNDSTFWLRLQSFRDAVETHTGVKGTTLSSNAPGLGAVFRGTIPEGFTQQDNMFIANMSVDYNFLETYGMEMQAGRPFSKEHGTDRAEAFIVNETAVKAWNWETPEKALGKKLVREGKEGRIIGVIKDFNFTSLTTPVSAMVIEMNPNQFNVLSVKFDNENVQPTIDKIEAEWNKMFPEKTFQFTFLDEQLNSQYQNFQNFGTIIQTFAGIAILISCLGVYGLVLFVVQRKVKEIGVRKVLGASVGNILQLIYRDFAWLLVTGFVLAIPASYYLMKQWLENFTYHTSIDAITYVMSFVMVVVIVALTIGYQAVKASLANPVSSLRSE
ncbi:ABC transporter permease [Fulvivirgaceae bacterium PWU4]|uniref:ABC transporter permease n=1 Tax=Chryseosolibacter histidini TaxID=2782349 RepID=A0AAP2DR41_9BACT|nr:ABC transporter permease [Chryseosolibacter histidini]MBT1700940.1 ABC transporter permease [Chryseosolibacter histidini]